MRGMPSSHAHHRLVHGSIHIRQQIQAYSQNICALHLDMFWISVAVRSERSVLLERAMKQSLSSTVNRINHLSTDYLSKGFPAPANRSYASILLARVVFASRDIATTDAQSHL